LAPLSAVGGSTKKDKRKDCKRRRGWAKEKAAAQATREREKSGRIVSGKGDVITSVKAKKSSSVKFSVA